MYIKENNDTISHRNRSSITSYYNIINTLVANN